MKKIICTWLLGLIFISGCSIIGNNGDSDAEETPSPEPTASPTPTSVPIPFILKKLTTEGAKIIEAQTGDEVLLKGIVFTGTVWTHPGTEDPAQYNYLNTPWDFRNVKSWGANTIVLYMDYYWFQTEAGFIYFDNILRQCRYNNLYVIPNLNVYPGGQNRGGIEFFEDEDNKDLLEDFWKTFVERYKDQREIAGYCLMDEPEMSGSSADQKSVITEYTERLIDAVREIDTVTPIFVQGAWGGVGTNILDIDPAKEHIVYNCHFYMPFSYTHAGYPWLSNGGIPRNVRYPGEYISSIHKADFTMLSSPVSGTFEWQSFDVTATIPAGVNMAFVSLYSNGPAISSVYFDDIEYKITNTADPGSAEFVSLPCGSFEESSPYGSMLVWIGDPNALGHTVERTSEFSSDGDYSIWFHGCTEQTVLESSDFWASSITGISIDPSAMDTLSVRVNIRGENAVADEYGIIIWWTAVSYDYLDKSAVEDLVDTLILQKRTADNRPIFIGEFSPSLVATRPDSINYLDDLINYFNVNGLNWTYYHYRDCYIQPDDLFMGIYNDAQGVSTNACRYVDTDVMDTLKKYY